MTVRARTTASSLRSRLATGLVLVLVGPLVLLAAGVGVWAPRQARDAAEATAVRDVRSVAVALAARCEAVGRAATATARQVAAYATGHGSIPAPAAQAAAVSAARSTPGAGVAIFDRDWELLAFAGPAASRRPAEAGGYGASCAAGLPGSDLRVAGLAERLPVNTAADGLVGQVVLWLPLEDSGLRVLRSELGVQGQFGVLGDGSRMLAASVPKTAPGGDPLPAAESASGPDLDQQPGRTQLQAAIDALRDSRAVGWQVGTRTATGAVSTGVGEQVAYAVRRPSPGIPFPLIATSQLPGHSLIRNLLLLALGVGLFALLPLRRLAARISSPVAEELTSTAEELHTSRLALADTFTSFGQALEHTHNLDKLLDTVATACLHGTGAIAGIALLIEDEPGPPAASLQVSGVASIPGPAAAAALAVLPGFAERYHRAAIPALGAPAVTGSSGVAGVIGTGLQPVFSRLAGAGPVAAVPIRTAGRVVGVLALARGEQAGAFDALALPRVRALADHAGTAITNVRRHQEVRQLSVTDPLTGVGNVRHLSATLSREVAGASRFDRPLTVLMLDLDHFKQVNDTLGHQFGDVVLREFARRMLACVREMDTVARSGGEEFAVVLPDTDVDGGSRVAERVIAAVRAEPFRQGGLQQAVTVSIGVAAFPRHGRTAAEVLQAADEALYAAKHHGRDRCEIAGRSPSASTVPQAG